jgi:hypothetical protein
MKKVICLMFVVGLALGAGIATADTAEEVKQAIMDTFAYGNENLMDAEDTVSQQGSLQFWSSGGLVHEVGADATPSQYESQSIHPKHIQVITLVEGQAAVALYYAEGSMQVKGQEPVSHYMTRAMEVFVKEDGKWKVRASHWSPIAAGAGTSQTAE